MDTQDRKKRMGLLEHLSRPLPSIFPSASSPSASPSPAAAADPWAGLTPAQLLQAAAELEAKAKAMEAPAPVLPVAPSLSVAEPLKASLDIPLPSLPNLAAAPAKPFKWSGAQASTAPSPNIEAHMTVSSFLHAAGQDFLNFVHGADTVFVKSEPVLQFSAQVLAKFYPLPGGVALALVNTAVSVEQQFAALKAQDGTGTDKLKRVVEILGSALSQELGAAGKPNAANDVALVASNAADILNLDPQILEQLAALAASQPQTLPGLALVVQAMVASRNTV